VEAVLVEEVSSSPHPAKSPKGNRQNANSKASFFMVRTPYDVLFGNIIQETDGKCKM
jgi:hypothetical protein